MRLEDRQIIISLFHALAAKDLANAEHYRSSGDLVKEQEALQSGFSSQEFADSPKLELLEVMVDTFTEVAEQEGVDMSTVVHCIHSDLKF